MVNILVTAIESRPTPDCYLHLLQGGGAVGDVVGSATAFGCRDWDFACVIAGIWDRGRDGSETAHAATQWVYDVAEELSLLSTGCYGADLGPDPRDAPLALKAFGPNLPRLARIKHRYDPSEVLRYTCPLPRAPLEPGLIILITGESCDGKDYCAEVWQSMFANLNTTVVSISDSTKQEYAKASGADLARLFSDREYKESHRSALTKFFLGQVQNRPQMPEEHFLDAVYAAQNADVLFITGMRDVAPIATFGHLVPHSRVLEVKVKADPETRRDRGGRINNACEVQSDGKSSKDTDSCPSFIFENDFEGREAAEDFAKRNLLPFCHEDLQQLSNMVRSVPNFPSRGIEFRDVLGISQQADGLELCTSML